MTDKLTKEEQAVLDRYELEIRQPDWHVVVADRDILVKAVRRLAPKLERLWVNIWEDEFGKYFATIQLSKVDADECRARPFGNTYVGRVVINLDGSSATWEGPND